MIGLVIVDVIKGTDVNILLVVIAGLTMAIVNFFISFICEKRKADK